MHDAAQLNHVALGCGLAMGELMQDEAEKKLLFVIHPNSSGAQRACVASWARRNHLRLAIVEAIKFPQDPAT